MSEQPGSVPDAPRQPEYPADPQAYGNPPAGPGQPPPSGNGPESPPPHYGSPQYATPDHGVLSHGAPGYPAPGYGASGYGAPGYGFAVPGAPPTGWRDPLVNPPGGGIDGWFTTIIGTVRRSARTVVIIALLGFSLPGAVLGAIVTYWQQSQFIEITDQTEAPLDALVPALSVLLVLLVGAVAATLVGAATTAAIVWAVTHETGTGQPVAVGQAFRYGLRRALPIWGWAVVGGLMTLIGLVFCILPGLYLAFALSMIGYVVIFERGSNPIARSFKLTHDHFGPALGRVLLSWLAYAVFSVVSNIVFGLIGGGVQVAAAQAAGDGPALGVSLVLTVVQAALAGPMSAVVVICLYATYAELRARQQPLSTPVLQAAL